MYPFSPVGSGGVNESVAPEPVGEYAQSCLGRERVFEYFSHQNGTPMAIYRLNYAIDMRYGVLHELARSIHEDRPIHLAMGHANIIWQGDANEMALRSLLHCSSPPETINITGPETMSIRWAAQELAARMGKEVTFTGTESETALLNNAAKSHQLFGYPKVTLLQMLDWTAAWVQSGGESWNKPTHFQERGNSNERTGSCNSTFSPEKLKALHEGLVIPAHPLALDENRKLDERRQRALTRYYAASGAGGVAVGVHSTQFEIRDKGIDLYEPVLRLAAEEVRKADLDRPFIMVAGVCGPTEQAVEETEIARKLGYDAVLLSMGGLSGWSEEDILRRTETIAQRMPVIGFYLQPSVGGNIFSFDFWRAFAEIPNIVAIKMAPFNRYQTIDVVRAVCYSSRRDDIALYTGNDDNIVNDLLTTYQFQVDGTPVTKPIVGGLLGHWAVWTKKAVELLEEIKEARTEERFAKEWLTRNVEITDSNAAFSIPHISLQAVFRASMRCFAGRGCCKEHGA